MGVKYSHINTPKDIIDINRDIRAKVPDFQRRKPLRRLARQSNFLNTILKTKAMRKKLGKDWPSAVGFAGMEYTKTVDTINARGREVHGKDWVPFDNKIGGNGVEKVR